MTRRAAKTPKVGAKGQPGRVVRAGGTVQMIEFTEYISNPNAPHILVNKVAGIYRMQPSLIKCTFALEEQSVGGIMRTIEAASLIWTDSAAWLDNADLFKWATAEMRKGTFSGTVVDDGGGRRGRTQ